MNQEKLNVMEEKAKLQTFSDVIENQEKEIKWLNIDLHQPKEDINDIFLKIEEQNEIFGSEW